MARDDSGAGTVVVAFVLGALTGAAVALLMAPQTGEETRRMLREKAREGADKAREGAEEAARQGRELWNRQRETLASAFERGREAYQQARGVQPPDGGPSQEGV
jgi:gas vesicle protein